MPVLNFQTKALLSAYDSATEGTRYGLWGDNVIGDVPVRYYTYYENMTEPADGFYIVAATGMGSGRYLLYDTQGSREIATYVGKTDVNGNYEIVYVNPFQITPHVQIQLMSDDHLVSARIISSEDTGCVISVRKVNTQVVEEVEWQTAESSPMEDELVSVFIISR